MFLFRISINIDAIQTLDFIFAKGKLNSAMKAVEAKTNTQSYIKITGGKHPLLKPYINPNVIINLLWHNFTPFKSKAAEFDTKIIP